MADYVGVDVTKTTRCRMCDRDFTYEYTGGRLRFYCNATCRTRASDVVRTTCDGCGRSCRKRRSLDSALCGACRGERVTRTCGTCGKSFDTTPARTRRFCSPACRAGATPRYEHREIACGICDEPFTATHPRQKWCTACIENGADRSRARRYNVSRADLAALKAKHDGLCWICRRNQGECIDHAHDTGTVRGYLCRGCNMALHFVERPDWWDQALAYLQGVMP